VAVAVAHFGRHHRRELAVQRRFDNTKLHCITPG